MRLMQNCWLVKCGAILVAGGLAIMCVGFGNDRIIPAPSQLRYIDARLVEVRSRTDTAAPTAFQRDTLVLVDRAGKERWLSLNTRLAKESGLPVLSGNGTLRVGYNRSDIYSAHMGDMQVVSYQSVIAVELAGHRALARIGMAIAGAGLLIGLAGVPLARRRMTRQREAVPA